MKNTLRVIDEFAEFCEEEVIVALTAHKVRQEFIAELLRARRMFLNFIESDAGRPT